MKKCKIVIDKDVLKRRLKNLKCKKGMKGLVLRLKKSEEGGANRRVVNRSNLELLSVWQKKNKKGLKGKLINVPLSVIYTNGDDANDNEGEWEFAQEIENSEFDFAFFHFDTLQILLEYESEKYKGLVVSGVKIDTDQNANGNALNCNFSFRLSGSGKVDSIAEDLGFPKIDFGLACPPKWDEGDKNKKPKDKLLGVFHAQVMSI